MDDVSTSDRSRRFAGARGVMIDGATPVGEAAWIWSAHPPKPTAEQCRAGDHIWVAAFYVTGQLAHWQCSGCVEKVSERPEPRWPQNRLAGFSGWIREPPRLVVRGSSPPASKRRWTTADGSALVEGDPSSIHHVGLAIPGLDESHAYTLLDPEGTVAVTYEPSRERGGPYSDHYWLTRYRVVGDALVRFVAHCFEESTLDTPFAQEPKRRVLLIGLRPLSAAS